MFEPTLEHVGPLGNSNSKTHDLGDGISAKVIENCRNGCVASGSVEVSVGNKPCVCYTAIMPETYASNSVGWCGWEVWLYTAPRGEMIDTEEKTYDNAVDESMRSFWMDRKLISYADAIKALTDEYEWLGYKKEGCR